MKKVLIAIIISGIFAVSFLISGALAAEDAVVLFLQGEVKIKGPAIDGWADAAVGMSLSKNDTIKTGADSWVEIGFGKGSRNVIRVKENTLVELSELGPIRLGLLKGEIRALVEKVAKDTTFEIKTPTAVCGARGTGWDTNTDGKAVTVDAYENKVFFYGLDKDGNPVADDPVIGAGQSGLLEGPGGTISIRDLPAERMRDWNRWKEDFSERRGFGGSGRDLDNRGGQSQNMMEDLMKGKEGSFEKNQRDRIDDRIKPGKTGSYSS